MQPLQVCWCINNHCFCCSWCNKINNIHNKFILVSFISGCTLLWQLIVGYNIIFWEQLRNDIDRPELTDLDESLESVSYCITMASGRSSMSACVIKPAKGRLYHTYYRNGVLFCCILIVFTSHSPLYMQMKSIQSEAPVIFVWFRLHQCKLHSCKKLDWIILSVIVII